jgi:hypothetical protein
MITANVNSNDCGQNRDTANAGARMKSLIDDIYDKVPEVTVILSTMVKSRDHRACAEDLSQQFRDLVKNDYSDKRVGLADIDAIIQMSQVSGDGIHPNDEGYKLFAASWWKAISRVEDEIQPPPTDGLIKDDSSTAGTGKCKKVAGNASGPVQTQKGSGHDDGIYKHNRIERGLIESARIQKANDDPAKWKSIPYNMHFADIIKNDPNSDRSLSLDDWIRVYQDFGPKTMYYFRQNLGGGKFGPTTTFDPKLSCGSSTASKIAFGDFNGDGLDDFFCMGQGSISVSLNRGGSPPKFESIGVVVPSVPEPFRVEIADIDGDGRADFCIVGKDLVVKCSRNAGQGDKYSWQGFSTLDGIRGVVFDKGLSPQSGPVDYKFHFGDINGDYRSDVLLVGNNGNVQTWTNRRSRGSGIVPDWVSSGITHEGVVSGPEQYINHAIKMARSTARTGSTISTSKKKATILTCWCGKTRVLAAPSSKPMVHSIATCAVPALTIMSGSMLTAIPTKSSPTPTTLHSGTLIIPLRSKLVLLGHSSTWLTGLATAAATYWSRIRQQAPSRCGRTNGVQARKP